MAQEASARLSLAFIVVAVCAGTIGAGLLAGVLFATGSIGGGKTIGVITEPAATTPAPESELVPSGVYGLVAPAVADITAHVRRNVQTVAGVVPESAVSTGTGSIVDRRGDILTAEHVVAGASSVTARLQNGTVRTARILGRDSSSDLAVLKIDPAGLDLRPVVLGSSNSLRIGDAVFTIGDPFGFTRSLSGGLVSGVDRTIVAPNGFTVAHAIQTDTAFNPGNSGGPLLDASGRLVGVVDQIANGGYQVSTNTGVGFAVPVELARAELSALEHGRRPAHAYLGVGTTDASPSGALVQTVRTTGPAHRAGVQKGDVVVGVDATPIRTASDLIAALGSRRPGATVELRIRRGSSHLTLRLKLVRQPSQAF